MPSVVLVTERFVSLATDVMRARGVDTASMVVLPKTELTEYGDETVMREIAEASVAAIRRTLVGG